jgi:hypothetical protein
MTAERADAALARPMHRNDVAQARQFNAVAPQRD